MFVPAASHQTEPGILQEPILEMKGIQRSFPGVLALQGVDLSVRRGEVHALLGENGAGKSTLLKILAGAYRMDAGSIILDGRLVDIRDPGHARALGIAIIYQELSILPNLSVAENIFLGRLPRRAGAPWLINWPACQTRSKMLLRSVGLDIDPMTSASDLKVAEQQMVEIAKALAEDARIVVMDEPTTSLTTREVDTLFETVRSLRSKGVSIIYVSHRLPEVEAICDRATVLRDGKVVGSVDVATTNARTWVSMMVGRDLNQLYVKKAVALGGERLRVANLSTPKLRSISFSLRAGEILGVAGLVGSGRTELARAIFGADPITEGEIFVDGKPVRLPSPTDAIAHSIALVPEDRKGQGVVLSLSIRENITLAKLSGVSRAGQIRPGQERKVASEYVGALRIATYGINQKVLNLSGGNQQKVVLAKWLYTNARILIVDEPTRGIDIGAKAEIYALLEDLAARGVAIIMISSEMPELIGMADRMLVMHEGRISAELKRQEFTEEAIMAHASGLGG